MTREVALPRVCINFPMRATKRLDTWLGDVAFSAIAETIEGLGFDGAALSEHPYPDDAWLGYGGHHALDPFVALSSWSAVTERIALMTALIVPAYRSPYLSAKAASSLDFVSNGRLILGVGAGYLEEEFRVLGADFASRGKFLDEAIPAMRAFWSNEDFDGPRFPSHGHTSLPLPAQPGGPPIWVGGNSAAARRRAVDLCDGWMPIAQNETMAQVTRTPALTDMASLTAQIADVAARRSQADKPGLDVSFTAFEADVLRSGTMDDFCDQLLPNLTAYADAGVTWLTIEPSSRSFGDFERDLSTLARRLPPASRVESAARIQI